MPAAVDAASCAVTGTLYDSVNITDAQMQVQSNYSLTLTLTGDTWKTDVISDNIKRAVLTEAILKTTVDQTAIGYEKAWMYQSGWSLSASDFERVSSTVLTVSIPAMPTYVLPAMGMETIYLDAVGGIPSYVCGGSSDITTITGHTSRHVFGRTATFTGTFFSATVSKSDRLIRAIGNYSVKIELFAETWATDIDSDPVKKAALVQAIFASNHNATVDTTYNLAFASQVSNASMTELVRDSDDTVTFTVAVLPTYALPGADNEVIDTLPIPAECIAGPVDLLAKRGAYNLTIVPRVADFSGNFFEDTCGDRCADGIEKTDEHIRSSVEFSTTITLTNAEWHPQITLSSKSSLRVSLARAIYASNWKTTDAGYTRAMEYLSESYICATGA